MSSRGRGWVIAIEWPARWQDDAKERLMPCFGGDVRVRIVVDDPATPIDGTVIEGYVYLDGNVPMVIHDPSGRSRRVSLAGAAWPCAPDIRTSPSPKADPRLRASRLDSPTWRLATALSCRDAARSNLHAGG